MVRAAAAAPSTHLGGEDDLAEFAARREALFEQSLENEKGRDDALTRL